MPRSMSIYILILINLVMSGMLSCIKQGTKAQHELKAMSTQEAQEEIQGYLEESLKSWFQIQGKQLDEIAFEKRISKVLDSKYIKDREKVLETILTHGLKDTAEFAGKNRQELQGAQLNPRMVVQAVRKAFMVDYKQNRNYNFAPTQTSRIYKTLALLPIEVLPFLTRYVTKKIRSKNPGNAPDGLTTQIGAVPLSPGAVREVVFHSIQRHFPQLALSSKVNDVYMVTQLHKNIIESIYLDEQKDVNNFLTIDHLSDQLPSLNRIVGRLNVLENLILNLDQEKNLKNLPPISIVFTDPFHLDLVKGVNRLRKSYPKFFSYVTGIGFNGNQVNPEAPSSLYSQELEELLTPTEQWAPKTIELDAILLDEAGIDGLKRHRLEVILSDAILEDSYFKALAEIDALNSRSKVTLSCFKNIKPLKKIADLLFKEGSFLLRSGIKVSFSQATSSALLVAP